MPNQAIDMKRFEQQVAFVTDQIGAAWSGDDEWSSARLGAVSTDEKNRVVEELLNRIYQDTSAQPDTSLGSKDEIRAAALDARSALQTPSIRSTICGFLGPITGKSARDVAIELAKACIPLVVTGQLAVPASPLVWGLIGFAAARIGAVWLCGDRT
jgi:hypothetical protein